MTYDACARATFLDPSSWAIVAVGMGLALVLAKSGRPMAATVIAMSSLLAAAFWAYTFFNFNCVELLSS